MPHLIVESTLAPETLDPRPLLHALPRRLPDSGVFGGPDIRGRTACLAVNATRRSAG